MSTNPYESPRMPDDPNSRPSQVPNVPQQLPVYNDLGLLVFNVRGFQLPPMCLKTGESTYDTFHLSTTFVPQSTMTAATVFGGVIGASIAKSTYGVPVSVFLPLSEQWMASARSNARKGWFIIGLGVILFVLSFPIAFFHAFAVLAGMVSLIACYIVGRVIGSRASQPFKVSRMNNDWIWIEGAAPEVAAKFPPVPIQ